MRFKIYSIIIILIVASSCRRANYFSDKVEGHDFEQYRTYAWLPPEENEEENGVNLNNDILIENIKNAVNQQMQERGFELDTENPDLLLKASTDTETRRELITTGPRFGWGGFGGWGHPYGGWGGWGHPYGGWGFGGGWGGFGGWGHPYGGWGWGGGYDVQQIHTQHATIVVDMFNRRTNQHIWRGGIEQRVDNSNRFQQRLPAHICRMFREFPVDAE